MKEINHQTDFLETSLIQTIVDKDILDLTTMCWTNFLKNKSNLHYTEQIENINEQQEFNIKFMKNNDKQNICY